jgi:hypothetical protein
MLFLCRIRRRLSHLRSELQRATPSCPRKVENVEKSGSPKISAGLRWQRPHASLDPRKALFEPGRDNWAHTARPILARDRLVRARTRSWTTARKVRLRSCATSSASRRAPTFSFPTAAGPFAASPLRTEIARPRQFSAQNSQPDILQANKPTMRGQHISIHRLTSSEAVRALSQRLQDRNGKRRPDVIERFR